MWAYPKCESTFPSRSQWECPSVCPVLFRFQQGLHKIPQLQARKPKAETYADMNIYWISLLCDLLSSLASFQCSLLHHLHPSSDVGLSKM